MTTPQLPLPLRAPSDQRFDTFVGNTHASATLRALAANTEHGVVYLGGAPASGKTHLLIAAIAAAQEADIDAAYLPLPLLREHLPQALDGRESAALIALDGLESIAGERELEIALFHFHNRARAAGCDVIYAARANPEGLNLALPDLRSRLSQALRFTLETPDDAMRRQILRQRARQRGLALEDAALDFLLRRVNRDMKELSHLFERIDRESLATQRRVTVPFLRELLAQGV